MSRISRLTFLLVVLAAQMVLADGAQYLIITHDNFNSAIQPLAEWRQKKGTPTRVTKLSEISPQTRDGIRNYIINAYNTWLPRPEFILLVGDTYRIPVGQTSPVKSDNYYATVDAHFKAELVVGRFPCRTEAECQTMVAKTLGYERSPMMSDTAWYRKGLVAVRFDNAGDTLGYYVRDLRYYTNLLRDSAGYVVDSLFWRDNKGWHGQGPDSVRHIINAVNDGRGHLLFRGFGTDDGTYHGWNIPMNVKPENTSNGFRLPIVYGGCCQTVFAPGGRGVGEAWVRAGTATTPKGAVAYLGNSIHSLASPWRSKVIQGFYKSMFLYDTLTVGKALFFGKDSLYRWLKYNGHPDTTKDSVARYVEQSLIGDPALQVWTDYPHSIQVEYPATVPLGPCVLHVVVTSGGAPKARALVCAWKGTEFHQYALTGADGSVDLSISSQAPGEFFVTATGQNLRPFEGTCQAVPGDVGVAVLVAPAGSLDSGAVVTPACTVANYGSTTESYEVRMRIGTGYDQRTLVSAHAPGSRVAVSFPDWTASGRGSYAVTCSTELAGDTDPTNDARYGLVTVGVKDVGAASIIAPTGTVDTNATVTPKATIRNFGTTAASFMTRFRIGTFYQDSVGVAGLGPGDSTVLSFKSWKALVRGTHAVVCSTAMAGDQNPDNDSAQGSVTVRVLDVTASKILAPTGTVDSGVSVTPRARVKNLGTEPASFPVTFTIAGVYTNVQQVAGLNPGESLDVAFYDWIAAVPRGIYSTKCSTALTGDKKASNNRKTGSLTVRVKDVGAVAIVAPAGTIDSGTSVVPIARLTNFGNTQLSFTVRFKVGTFYNKSRSKTLKAYASDTAAFPAWLATKLGTHVTRCSTSLSGDVNAGNNLILGQVTVESPAEMSFELPTSLPIPESSGGQHNLEPGALELPSESPDRSGVMAGRSSIADQLGLAVAPNPAGGFVNVSYSLPTPGAATLELCDVRGRLVQTLRCGHCEGMATLRVEVRNLARGVYLLRLESSGQVLIRKLVLE